MPAAIGDLPLPPLMVGPGTDLGHRLGLPPRTPAGQWLKSLFLLPFLVPFLLLLVVLLALGAVVFLIGLAIHRSRARIAADLRSRRHRVDVETDRFPVYPGEEIEFVLLQPTRPRLHGITARLVCTEVARYRQGTNTETATHPVCTVDAELEEDLAGGSAAPARILGRVRVPDDAMHSFFGKHNEIAWAIEVERSFGGAATAVTRRELLVFPSSLPWSEPATFGDLTPRQRHGFGSGGVAA